MFPREHETIARGPEELAVGHSVVKDATWPGRRTKDWASLPAFRFRDPNRPRLPFPLRSGSKHWPARGNSQVGEPAAVRRPDRTRVLVDARIQVVQGVAALRIETNKTMAAAHADKRERAAIGRPCQVVRCAFLGDDVLDVLSGGLHEEDL